MSLPRWPVAIWLAPVVTALAVFVARSDIPIRVPEPYTVGLTGTALAAVFLVAPVCAAVAAWEAGRLRRAGWHVWPHARPMAVVAMRALTPVLAMGVVALSAALVVKFRSAGLLAVPDLRLVAKTLAVLAAHVVLGYAIGLRVPTIIAAASVLLVDYAWMVLPAAMQPPWLRHLNGTWISCCAVYVDVAPTALAAALLMAAGLAGAGLTLLQRPHAGRIALAFALPVFAFVGASSLVNSMGPDPVVPRSDSALVCSATEPRVCVWPEHESRLSEVSTAISRATASWKHAGFAVADIYTEQRTGGPSGSAVFGFSPQSRTVDVVGGLTTGIVPPGRCGPGAAPGHDPRDYVRAWLLLAGGITSAESGVAPDVAQSVERQLNMSTDAQREWLMRRMRCEPVTD